MTFWVVTGVLLVVLLAAMWRMDRKAQRRGARLRASGDMSRHVGLEGRASPYAQGTSHHQGGGVG
jgi:hypothetical protein